MGVFRQQVEAIRKDVVALRAERVRLAGLTEAATKADRQRLWLLKLGHTLLRGVSFGLMGLRGRVHQCEKRLAEMQALREAAAQKLDCKIAELVDQGASFEVFTRDYEGSATILTTDPNGYPLDWAEISRAVKERDGYACQRCGATGVALHVHHVVKLREGGSNELPNLITLCEVCHAFEHPHMR